MMMGVRGRTLVGYYYYYYYQYSWCDTLHQKFLPFWDGTRQDKTRQDKTIQDNMTFTTTRTDIV